MKSFQPQRICQPELLDHASPTAAAGSLRDLTIFHRYLGGRLVLQHLLGPYLRGSTAPATILDVGAASGQTGHWIEHRWPTTRVTSLDYKLDHLRQGRGDRVAADAFRPPFPPRSFDLVVCSLFLHHFTDEQIPRLLAGLHAVSRRALLINDLVRGPFSYYFVPATGWLFGWDPITLHDGPVSVQAAFQPGELRALVARAGLPQPRVRTYWPWGRISAAIPH